MQKISNTFAWMTSIFLTNYTRDLTFVANESYFALVCCACIVYGFINHIYGDTTHAEIYVNWVHKKRCVYWGGAAGERSETADCPPSINTPFFMCAIQVFIRYLSFPADNEKPCYNVTRNSKNSEHFRLKFKKIGAGMMTSIFLNLL